MVNLFGHSRGLHIYMHAKLFEHHVCYNMCVAVVPEPHQFDNLLQLMASCQQTSSLLAFQDLRRPILA